MLRIDLEAAGIPYQDEEGRFLDFHSLRHSDVKLTLKTYTHVGLYDLAGAVEKLSEFSGHAAEIKAARMPTRCLMAIVVVIPNPSEWLRDLRRRIKRAADET